MSENWNWKWLRFIFILRSVFADLYLASKPKNVFSMTCSFRDMRFVGSYLIQNENSLSGRSAKAVQSRQTNIG